MAHTHTHPPIARKHHTHKRAGTQRQHIQRTYENAHAHTITHSLVHTLLGIIVKDFLKTPNPTMLMQLITIASQPIESRDLNLTKLNPAREK